MDLVIQTKLVITKTIEEGIFKMPNKPLYWEKFNYSSVRAVVPHKVNRRGEEVITSYTFIDIEILNFRCKNLSIKALEDYISTINKNKSDNVDVFKNIRKDEEYILSLLNEVEVQIRQPNYLDTISKSNFLLKVDEHRDLLLTFKEDYLW